MAQSSGYKFPILNSSGIPTSTIVDMGDMFVRKEMFLDAGLRSWGDNRDGELGNGTVNIYYSSPIQVGSLTNWKQVSAGWINGGGIKTDGTLWMWGFGANGQNGNGTTASYSSPIQIGTLTGWKQIMCGFETTYAIKTDGTLWAWGGNTSGQLGNGTRTSYSSPIQIGALTNWKSLHYNGVQGSTANTDYSMAAIKTDGTLWMWGSNLLGNLGNGTNSNYYSSPIQVGSLTNWKQCGAGGTRGVQAIKTDGTLWYWGNVQGTFTLVSSPIQVGSATNWKTLACGYNGAAIKTDGTLWVWGEGGAFSRLGLGSTTIFPVTAPVQLGALTNWKSISAGDNFIAIKTDGTLWTWGVGQQYGSIGNGTVSNYGSPIQIGTLTGWKQVAGGGGYGTGAWAMAIFSSDLP